MVVLRLLAAAVLLVLSQAAAAQAPPGVCAVQPHYVGCEPAAGVATPDNTLTVVTPAGLRTLSVGQLLGQLAPPGVTTPATVPHTVLVGGTGPNFATLADPVAHAALLSQGNIGLYEHANGVAALTPAQRAALYATWGLPATGQRRSLGEVGAPVPVDAGYLSYFGGTYPPEVNMNAVSGAGVGSGTYTAVLGDARPGITYQGYYSAADLTNMRASIAAAMAAGAQNVGVVLTPNAAGVDLDDAFATSPYYANVRAAALAGGALTLDAPPSFWAALGAPYQSIVSQEIGWGNANHLRTSLILSPFATAADASGHTGGCGFDPSMLANARRELGALIAAGTVPTQFVVESYPPPGCTANDWQAGAPPGSLDELALFVARVANTSPPGTAPSPCRTSP